MGFGKDFRIDMSSSLSFAQLLPRRFRGALASLVVFTTNVGICAPESPRAENPTAPPSAAPPSAVAPADQARLDRAKEEVSQAESLYAEEKYDEALQLFRSAYENMAGHPAQGTVLFNVAKCSEQLGQLDDALSAYEGYLATLAEDSPDRNATRAKVDELKAKLEARKAEPAAPEVDPYAEAKERVERAEKLYADGNYDAALTEFGRAYETMLGHPARGYVLFNIGKCQEKLYLYDDAIASYRRYLQEATADAEDRPSVEAKIELLEGLLGTLEVVVLSTKGQTPTNYQVWVDGRLIGEGTKKFSIPGGNHEVEVRAEGFEIQNQEVQLPSRSEKKLSFDLVPLAKEYRGLSPTYFWTSSGLALASGLTGGVFGIMTLSKRSAIDNKLPPQVTDDDKSSLERRALTADLFFIGAGVFATTAVILAINTDWKGEPAEEEGPVSVKKIGLAPTIGGAALSVQGAF